MYIFNLKNIKTINMGLFLNNKIKANYFSKILIIIIVEYIAWNVLQKSVF